MRGLLTLKGMPVEKLKEIIDTAIEFKNGKKANYANLRMANLFFENSTRTQYSFQSAMLNLGITPIQVNLETSSVAKGESLYDTVKTFEAIGVNGVVIRHSADEYYKGLSNVKIPIFNAGDGRSDHPTQSLLDLMTIYEEFGGFKGLKFCFVGDIKHSRVAHGTADIARRLGMEVSISGPEIFKDDTAPFIAFEKAVETSDILNLLRIQLERHDGIKIEKSEYFKTYGLTTARVAKMKPKAIIMHPAPINRGVEIADDVAECPKSRIYKQMQNGVFIRMAVISMVLENRL